MSAVHSWDLFDTLIGRKCGTPAFLFEQMAKIVNDPQFPEKRRTAERKLQEKNIEYSLDDIYASYDLLYGADRAVFFSKLEWKLELENVFPIKRNVKYLKNEDVIVSDMYLSELQLRELMRKAGIEFTGKIYVSCYGKFHGTIWKEIKEKIRYHCGDNKNTDIHTPTRFGINTRLAKTEMINFEKQMLNLQPDMAWWLRYKRLSKFEVEKLDWLNILQLELNFPLLLAASQVLYQHVIKHNVKKLLFMSRDCQLFHRMWQKLYPNIPSEYIYINRDCLCFGDDDYFAYLNSKLERNYLLVDLAASCGSLKKAAPKLKLDAPKLWTLVFLPGFNVQYKPIELYYATTNTQTTINNTLLEMLNYADHWHVCGVKDDIPVFDQENEYDMNIVKKYHAVFGDALNDAPPIHFKHPEKVIKYLLPAIHAEGAYLRKVFPIHLIFENARKNKTQKIA